MKSSATIFSFSFLVTASFGQWGTATTWRKEVSDEEPYHCDALDVLWLMDGTWCRVTPSSSWPFTTEVSNTQPCLWDRWSMSGRTASTWARLGRCRPSRSGWLWPETPQPSPGPGTRRWGRKDQRALLAGAVLEGSHSTSLFSSLLSSKRHTLHSVYCLQQNAPATSC